MAPNTIIEVLLFGILCYVAAIFFYITNIPTSSQELTVDKVSYGVQFLDHIPMKVNECRYMTPYIINPIEHNPELEF